MAPSALSEVVEPCRAWADPAGLERRQQRGHGGRDIAHHRRDDGAITVHFRRHDVELNKLRRRRPLRALAVAEQPVQARADQHHHIGMRQREGARRGNRLRMVVGQQALGHGHRQERDPGLLDE